MRVRQLIYEVSVLILTIVFSTVGLYLIIVLHSAHEFLRDAKKTLREVNDRLPEILQDIESTARHIRRTSDSIGGGLQTVGNGIESLALSPVVAASSLVGFARKGLKTWRKIRHHSETV